MSENVVLNRRDVVMGSLAAGLWGLTYSGVVRASEAGVLRSGCASPGGENAGGILKKILHVGVFTDDLDRTARKFALLGMPCAEIVESKKMGVKIGLLMAGEGSLEVVQITEPGKSEDLLSRIVLAQGGILNHVCFEVDDLGEAIAHFEKNGARLIDGCPRLGVQGLIAFFHPETTEGVLIELCQV